MHQMASVNNTTTTNCASCGKGGGNFNTCNKCNMVKYCNAACKKKHRSKHKKQCEKRVAELHDEALFKEPPPPEDCPICFLPLPHDVGETNFQSCCDKVICIGCIYEMDVVHGRGKIGLCPFCRKPDTSSGSEEENVRIKKLMDVNNADAFYKLAGCYFRGVEGMPQDMAKANELYLKAGELGCAVAYYNLGNSYYNGNGVDVDEKKAKHYFELSAMNGDVDARYNVAGMEGRAGNYDRAYKHFVLSARAGHKDSLDAVKEGFMDGIVTKDEYANTLRAYQKIRDEMKSGDRDKAEAFYQRRGRRG